MSHGPIIPDDVLKAQGPVQKVDVANRELTMDMNHVPTAFFLPLGCPILLNNERVKLRLLQPRDYVQAIYQFSGGARVARRIEVSRSTPSCRPMS